MKATDSVLRNYLTEYLLGQMPFNDKDINILLELDRKFKSFSSSTAGKTLLLTKPV